jgi:malate/lactate dehydrogenase
MPKIFKANPNIVVLMITNPVDVLTHIAIKMFPKKKNQIMGSGTTLDSARFRHLLSQQLNVNAKSIHAYIMGEHGDSEFPVWSTATIGNSKLIDHKKFNKKDQNKIFDETRNAAYAIIAGKQSTYYGIGSAASYVLRAIIHDKRIVLPVSHLIENVYGVSGVCLSTPAIVGQNGITESLDLELSKEEQKLFKNSAKVLKKAIKSVS